MRLRNKILVGVTVAVGIIFSISVGVSYYLMSQYPVLENAFDNNPFKFLSAASRAAINQVVSTPTKSFNIEDAERDYNKTVEFPENRLECETAEQIIEWSVAHQSQPWVENITEFLQESQILIGDITLHLVFINTESGENPVMTVSYLASNNTQIIEKGWNGIVTYHSYTGLVTEEFAVENLKYYGNSKLIVNSIIQNLNGAIKLIEE